jgi:hypothetical protein
MDTYRVVTCQGFHIFKTPGSELALRLSALYALYPLEYSWYSFLLQAEWTPGPRAPKTNRQIEKALWSDCESNRDFSDNEQLLRLRMCELCSGQGRDMPQSFPSYLVQLVSCFHWDSQRQHKELPQAFIPQFRRWTTGNRAQNVKRNSKFNCSGRMVRQRAVSTWRK